MGVGPARQHSSPLAFPSGGWATFPTPRTFPTGNHLLKLLLLPSALHRHLVRTPEHALKVLFTCRFCDLPWTGW